MKERRKWEKFGSAVNASAEEEKSRTVVSTEEVTLERPQLQKKGEEQHVDQLQALAEQNVSLLVCRICGKKGDHWTSKCPYKDIAASKGITVGEKAPEDDGGSGGAKQSSSGYVPPSLRPGAKVEPESMSKRSASSHWCCLLHPFVGIWGRSGQSCPLGCAKSHSLVTRFLLLSLSLFIYLFIYSRAQAGGEFHTHYESLG